MGLGAAAPLSPPLTHPGQQQKPHLLAIMPPVATASAPRGFPPLPRASSCQAAARGCSSPHGEVLLSEKFPGCREIKSEQSRGKYGNSELITIFQIRSPSSLVLHDEQRFLNLSCHSSVLKSLVLISLLYIKAVLITVLGLSYWGSVKQLFQRTITAAPHLCSCRCSQ